MPSGRHLFAGATLLFLTGAGMLAGGIFEIVVQRTGTATEAQMTDCVELMSRYHQVSCTGTWTTGDLVFGNGHVAMGIVDGANESDIGRSVPVRLWGDHAYVASLRVPIILIALAIGILAAGVHMVRRRSGVARLRGAQGQR